MYNNIIQISPTPYSLPHPQKMFSKFFNSFSPYIFYIIAFLYISYVVAFLGIASINSTYVEVLSTVTQTFIMLFLLLKFHPFSKKETITLSPIERRLIFGSGVLLATNLILSKLYRTLFNRNLNTDISNVKSEIQNNGNTIANIL